MGSIDVGSIKQIPVPGHDNGQKLMHQQLQGVGVMQLQHANFVQSRVHQPYHGMS